MMSPVTARRPPLLGLTGGLGAGKSTALAALEALGAAVLSTDEVVHELYDSDAVRGAVIERWGAQIAPNGRVDRSAVADRAFADADERAWLEQLLWPRVGERVSAWVADVTARQPPPRVAVVETPLLFEAGMEGLYDATLAVVSQEETRRARAAARGHALVDERASRQLPQEEKVRRATFAVHNDGTVNDLERELSAVLEKLDR